MNDLTTKWAISREAFPKWSAPVLSSSEAALAIHGRARLFPSVPAWLHHLLHAPSLCYGFQCRDLAAFAFPASFCVCLSGSGCLCFLDAGNSHPFISFLSSALVHTSINLLLIWDPGLQAEQPWRQSLSQVVLGLNNPCNSLCTTSSSPFSLFLTLAPSFCPFPCVIPSLLSLFIPAFYSSQLLPLLFLGLSSSSPPVSCLFP